MPQKNMSKMLVVAFDDESKAYEGTKAAKRAMKSWANPGNHQPHSR